MELLRARHQPAGWPPWLPDVLGLPTTAAPNPSRYRRRDRIQTRKNRRGILLCGYTSESDSSRSDRPMRRAKLVIATRSSGDLALRGSGLKTALSDGVHRQRNVMRIVPAKTTGRKVLRLNRSLRTDL